jgi:hypothetical protein
MDPDANLKEQRELVRHMLRKIDEENEVPGPSNIARLCELVDALDGWMSKGGFAPKAWKR